MDLTHKLSFSYYKPIAVLNDGHRISLVQHIDTKKIFIKKILDVYNLNIYEYLYNNSIAGTPKIIDYYEENNQLFLIEEYISGETLQEKIQNKSLSENDILSYMMDLCDILHKLHTCEPAIIHRDIKPSNIIITNYNRAVLLDFNAAKRFSSSESEDTMLLGTQGYAAPEQYGFGSSSPQTDIYALGILFKELLESINCVSIHYQSIINKCTQINPAERFQNIDELKLSFNTSAHSSPKYVPPGFRTLTPWKMIIASIFYVFVAWMAMTIEIQNTYGFALWLERIFLLLMCISIPVIFFNYLDIQKLMPLCRSKNQFLRYLGIVLLNTLVIFSLFLILMIFESAF